MTRLLALQLTVLTGFSGLSYQIAWQKPRKMPSTAAVASEW